MRVTNLPTDLLRTFVTAIDLGGYTRAAEVLGRSQPAVSLQMQRLETLLGNKLIIQSGREMKLTEDGKALAVLARQILRLNDMAVGRFERLRPDDTLRVGLPIDYAMALTQTSLTGLARDHPEMGVEIHCELSRRLLDSLHRDELDVALALYPGTDLQYLTRHWRERPVWVAAEQRQFQRHEPVPLVTHPEGCEYRNRMTEALTAARRNWRIAFSSPGIGSLQRAVLDGLGASSLTGPTVLAGMRRIPRSEGFPELRDLHVGLFYKHARLGTAGHRVVDHLIDTIDAALGGSVSAS